MENITGQILQPGYKFFIGTSKDLSIKTTLKKFFSSFLNNMTNISHFNHLLLYLVFLTIYNILSCFIDIFYK